MGSKGGGANLDAIKDSKVGQTAVKNAIAVLQEFYDKQGGALLQRQVPEMEAYKGMGSKGGGVLGMLEVIESDFARVVSDTTAEEMQAAAEYSTFMATAESDVKAKHKLEEDT